MKVLWITNTIFPDLSKALDNKAPVVGGWMYGLAYNQVKAGIKLTVATARPNILRKQISLNGINYFLLNGNKPITQYDSSLEEQWRNLIFEINPDIVHIHGTEYAHGLSLIKACPNLNYVISIQGLISVCSRYYTGAIPIDQIKKHRTFRDFVKKDGILQAQNKFQNRGELIEKQYFNLVDNFIGRTHWDLDHTKTLNPYAVYHFCNESLRDTFYTSEKWNISTKQDHTIFLSQGGYPLKGLHQVVKAISFLKDNFPDLKVRVAGENIIKADSIKNRLALSGYGNYILHLIRKFRLQNHIEFTGYLDEHQMVKEYLNCHLFICPSSIENSPNSLGEAQLLGVPSIASYVGGIPDMVQHGETGLLYRFEEVEMMAQAIKTIFTDSSLAEKLSENGIKEASKRHDRNENLRKTLEIYQIIKANH